MARIFLICISCGLAPCRADATNSVEHLRGLTLQQALDRLQNSTSSKEIVTQLRMRSARQEVRFELTIEPNPEELSWLILLNQTKRGFESADRDNQAAGYELTVTDSTKVGRRRLYSGVWVWRRKDPQPLVLPDTPVPVSGEPVEQFAGVDALMREFLVDHNAAGATVAIAHDGELLYSRGFGWMDVESQTPMPPDAVMRIASVSKPITAVAVMRLMQQQRLNLDDSVLPLLRRRGRAQPVDDRWNHITIRQLLQHTGGWDQDSTADPMFQPAAARDALKLEGLARPDDMVAWQLTRPLDFEPGTRYAYCNLGYCVLGRVIEAITQQTYSRSIAEQILEPVGMTSTRPAKTRLEDRGEREVRYYMQNEERSLAFWSMRPDAKGRRKPQEVARPYGAWDVEVMDAHGGWVSSAPDLVKFVSMTFDDRAGLLSEETRATMLDRPAHVYRGAGFWYGCGWQVRPMGRSQFDVWHNGRFDGTSSLLVRRWDGFAWAVLFNTDVDPSGEMLTRLVENRLNHAIEAHPIIDSH